jgi:hypothetical protein
MLSPHATKQDLVGTDDAAGYLAAASAAIVSAWTDDEVTRWLERASDVVDELTCRASFDCDEFGNATDPDLAAALSTATCAVVEQWLEVGEENDVDGLAGTQVSVTGFSGMRAPAVGPRALRPLRRAGLLGQPHTLVDQVVYP